MSVRQMMMGRKPDAGAWTPADLSPQAWYDADDASTFTYSSGSVVEQWDDKSGNGYHLLQTTVANQPSRSGTINSRSAVVFDGTDDSMLSTPAFTAPSKPFTILAVARNTATSGQRNVVLPGGSGTDGRIFRTSGGTIDIYQGAFLSTSASWGTTAAHAVVAVFNGASSKIAYDSNAYSTGNAGTHSFGTSWRVGSLGPGTSEFWQGEVCEIVCVAGEISSSDLTEWWDYCSTKWGTP